MKKRLHFSIDDLFHVINEITNSVTINGQEIKVLKSDPSKAIYNKFGKFICNEQLVWVNGVGHNMTDWDTKTIIEVVSDSSLSLALVDVEELTSLLEEDYLIKLSNGRPMRNMDRQWMVQEYNSRINLEVEFLELLDTREYTLVA
jgi:hypothetical protein